MRKWITSWCFHRLLNWPFTLHVVWQRELPFFESSIEESWPYCDFIMTVTSAHIFPNCKYSHVNTLVNSLNTVYRNWRKLNNDKQYIFFGKLKDQIKIKCRIKQNEQLNRVVSLCWQFEWVNTLIFCGLVSGSYCSTGCLKVSFLQIIISESIPELKRQHFPCFHSLFCYQPQQLIKWTSCRKVRLCTEGVCTMEFHISKSHFFVTFWSEGCTPNARTFCALKLGESLKEACSLGHSSEDCKRGGYRDYTLHAVSRERAFIKASFCWRRWCATQQGTCLFVQSLICAFQHGSVYITGGIHGIWYVYIRLSASRWG